MEYQIRDIALADFGRKELDIAQQEMPGLMATRAKYGSIKAAIIFCGDVGFAPVTSDQKIISHKYHPLVL